MTIEIQKKGWNKLGALLEDLYGMAHSSNDYFYDDQIKYAKREALRIEKHIIKILDLYNKLEPKA
jgi:hypothetical protein